MARRHGHMNNTVASDHVVAEYVLAVAADHELRPAEGTGALECDFEGEIVADRETFVYRLMADLSGALLQAGDLVPVVAVHEKVFHKDFVVFWDLTKVKIILII